MNPQPDFANVDNLLKLIQNLLEKDFYLNKKDYCQKWGISQTKLDELVSTGFLTEKNGALQKGCQPAGKHKYMFAFFNPHLGRIQLQPF